MAFGRNASRGRGGRDGGQRTKIDAILPSDNCGFGDDQPRFGFSVELKTRFTKDRESLNVRAMVAGLIPALNDARIRFALPSGISLISLIFLSLA